MSSASEQTLLYLTRAEVEATAISASAVADALQTALAGVRAGRTWNVPKSSVQPGDGRLFQGMLALAGDPPIATVKSVGLSAANASRGLPLISALITVFDSTTGVPLAVMNGAAVTATRTAAMTLLAARYLARSDSATLGLVRAGVQARSHLAALAAEFPLHRVLVMGRNPDNVERLLAEIRAQGLEASAADAETLLGHSDMVATSVPFTPGFEPFLDAGRLAPGAFAGMCDQGRTWLPATLDAFDRLLIDDLAQERDEIAHGHGMVDIDKVGGDLAALVGGEFAPRRHEAERLGFVFRGTALADLAAAALVLDAALQRGLGQRLPV